MREILFRGKRLDGGEWVCGNSIIMLNNPEADKPYDIAIFDEHWQLWQTVEPETVGQYTGLKDKNGKKIFEGDICGCFCKTQIFEVKYCDDRCGYFFDECVTSGGCKPAPECLGNLRNTIEVIGNIHDNPELLDENLDKIHRKATEKMLAYSREISEWVAEKLPETDDFYVIYAYINRNVHSYKERMRECWLDSEFELESIDARRDW